ncbi:hypothetical protein IQ62_42715 [Streptomyces scabiei]|uniref:hypothetical protein n=1 Tax=Streptomyces scabiei TaxID=1930 RepID=UPI0004E640F7|nr:hypothetical protein [Streptomyces scabiei]KFF95346.1 hypothetical protein IQ62_42715 [Streptomyces scabiei]
MVDECLARLLRGGGSTADNKVFLGLLTALDLTRDEQRERIADWTALCSDAPSTVAAHAQSVLAGFALDGELGPRRLAEAMRTAAATGAYGTAWSVLREALPPLLAELAGEGAAKTPARGLGELVAVAAECVERSGAHRELPYLAEAAERRGSFRLVTQARRLRAALEEMEEAAAV